MARYPKNRDHIDSLNEESDGNFAQRTQRTEDYSSRKILIWLQNQDLCESVQNYLYSLLPLAAIRTVDSEEKAFEQANKGEWNTFVVDVQEENVSNSEFVKAANNNPDVSLIALDYENLGKEEESPVQLDQLRRLFDFDPKKSDMDPEPETDMDDE